MTNLTPAQMRDYIIRAAGMATQNYIQSDSEMRRRIGVLLDKAISEDDIMRGFLGYGGPMKDRDILKGGSLADAEDRI